MAEAERVVAWVVLTEVDWGIGVHLIYLFSLLFFGRRCDF